MTRAIRRVCTRWALVAAGLLLPGAAGGLHAQAAPAVEAADPAAEAPPAGSAEIPAAADSSARRAPRFPFRAEGELLVGASLHALTAPLRWRSREWALAGVSLAAVAIASPLDEDGRRLMADIRSDRNTRIELLIEPFGAVGSLYLLGGMLATGVALDDETLRYTAVEGMAAGLVAGGIITPALQRAIGRAKPREGLPANTFDPFGGDRSLPSGHTTQAFAVASVIATEYDHPAVGVAAYGLAAAVGASRMYRRSHYLSDVVGAAIIGTVTGQAVARYGMRRRESLTVSPLLGAGRAGLVVDLGF